MNSSNKKARSERNRTPIGHLNTTQYLPNNSAKKRFSPNLSRRPNLNETVQPGSSSELKFKSKLVGNHVPNYEAEFDIAYNGYLQAFMQKQCVTNQIRSHREVIEDQLLIQKENLVKKQGILQEIVADTKNIHVNNEVIEITDHLKDNFVVFNNVCATYNMKENLNRFQNDLNFKCDKIVLKNIKPWDQEEYEKFDRVLENCVQAIEKIINSGRNFKEVHNLAERVKNCNEIIDNVEKTQHAIAEQEKNATYSFLQNISDFFASKYNNLFK